MPGLGTGKDVLTTGQIARLFGVAPRTVAMWCDTGRLRHDRLPGSDDRRVRRAEAIKFAEENGIPTPPGLDDTPAVLLAGYGGPALALGGCRTRSAPTAFEAGLAAAGAWPTVAVIDARGLGTQSARELSRVLAAAKQPPVLVGVRTEDDAADWPGVRVVAAHELADAVREALP